MAMTVFLYLACGIENKNNKRGGLCLWVGGKKKEREEKKKKNSPSLHPKFEFATDIECRLSNLESGSNMLVFKMGSEEKGIIR